MGVASAEMEKRIIGRAKGIKVAYETSILVVELGNWVLKSGKSWSKMELDMML